MKIAFVSSEVVPFAKTGGLADVAGSLPIALKQQGHEVCVFMPRYKCVDKRKFGLETVTKRVRLRLGKATKEFNLYKTVLPGSDVPVYFIDKDSYFNREGLYLTQGQDFSDNAQRFHYFSLAVLESLKVLGWPVDILHCNDWQTGMIPLYLKTVLAEDPFFRQTTSVYTIHNLAYQGLFNQEILSELGLPDHLFHPDYLEFWGKVNFSKAGLVYADTLSTVSDRYSREIQTSEFGCGLDGLLSKRAQDLLGVVNGLDYQLWDPQNDPKIPVQYGFDNLELKQESKKALLEASGLPYRADCPVIGIISRLADQKGFDILAGAIDRILTEDVQLVLLGTGEAKYHELFSDLDRRYPDRIKSHLKFDAVLAQLIYAGSDLFLMPSLYEPCGLGQLISLRYGTVPVVRETGGLADTIVDADLSSETGNGFVFSDYSADALFQTVNRAITCYHQDPVRWKGLQRVGMANDFSWTASAKVYTQIYQKTQEKALVPA